MHSKHFLCYFAHLLTRCMFPVVGAYFPRLKSKVYLCWGGSRGVTRLKFKIKSIRPTRVTSVLSSGKYHPSLLKAILALVLSDCIVRTENESIPQFLKLSNFFLRPPDQNMSCSFFLQVHFSTQIVVADPRFGRAGPRKYFQNFVSVAKSSDMMKVSQSSFP